MDNIDILQALHADLAPYVATHKGQLSVSGTYVETLDALSVTPQGFLVILEWLGEETTAEINQAYIGVMRQEIGIYVAHQPGLPLKQGEGLWLTPGGKTLLERCNAIRDRIREIRLPDLQETTREFDYRGARQVLTPDGLPLRAFRLEFHLHNALPEPEYRNVNPPMP